jgi:hypothetical protein
MRRFTYFIPNVSGFNEQMAANFGLLRRFQGSGGEFVCPTIIASAGPMGAQGVLFAEGPVPPTYDGERQTWIEGHATRNGADPLRYFVGVTKGLHPTPADLVRSKVISGYEPKLGDGNKWTIPLVLRLDRAEVTRRPTVPDKWHKVNVPQIMGMEGGKLCFTVRAQHKAILAVAKTAWDRWVDNTGQPMEDGVRGAVELLATNYRIGVEEVMLLELFDEGIVSLILSLAVDVPAIQECASALSILNEQISAKV